jgi:hypothetical protein
MERIRALMIPTAKPPMIRPAMSIPIWTEAAWMIPAMRAMIAPIAMVFLRPRCGCERGRLHWKVGIGIT